MMRTKHRLYACPAYNDSHLLVVQAGNLGIVFVQFLELRRASRVSRLVALPSAYLVCARVSKG
jgi:hypothetical protein